MRRFPPYTRASSGPNDGGNPKDDDSTVHDYRLHSIHGLYSRSRDIHVIHDVTSKLGVIFMDGYYYGPGEKKTLGTQGLCVYFPLSLCFVNVRECRRFLRVIYRILTLNGIIIALYRFLTDRIDYVLAISVGTFFINVDRDLETMIDTHTSLWDQFNIWGRSAAILVGLSVLLKVVKFFERILFQCQPTARRLRRRRFEDLEERARSIDPHTTSYSWEYWSDEEELTRDPKWSDPDVAFINFHLHPLHLVDSLCSRSDESKFSGIECGLRG